MWIAFKSLYLWYSRQRENTPTINNLGCELLSKVYIFDIRDNSDEYKETQRIVVNCFQKFISLIFETTCQTLSFAMFLLWIAFKSLYLWYSRQLLRFNTHPPIGCELLSKVYIFDIRDNCTIVLNLLASVVNCFQKFISLIFETTLTYKETPYCVLWIAFKSLYLWYSRQLSFQLQTYLKGCELLSKVYIFDIRDNFLYEFNFCTIVVNCFQKFISLIFETTVHVWIQFTRWLWIAFKSLYLWYSRQQLE